MKVIDYDTVLRALNEAVKAKGHDYVYPRQTDRGGWCYNVWQGQPDCIVGWAMVWLGVPVEWFTAKADRTDADAGEVCSTLLMEGEYEFTEEARILLTQVQSRQDCGEPWGQAVTCSHLGEQWFESLAPVPA